MSVFSSLVNHKHALELKGGDIQVLGHVLCRFSSWSSRTMARRSWQKAVMDQSCLVHGDSMQMRGRVPWKPEASGIIFTKPNNEIFMVPKAMPPWPPRHTQNYVPLLLWGAFKPIKLKSSSLIITTVHQERICYRIGDKMCIS